MDTILNIFKTVSSTPDLASKVGQTAKDVFNIGKNTKDIVSSIRNKIKKEETSSDIDNVISRIRELRIGSGFAYI